MFFKTKTTWHKIFDSKEEAEKVLKLNDPFPVVTEKKTFCVVRTEEEIFAVDDKCPHQGASLSGGVCEKGMIVCPWHHYQFNLKNGRQVGGDGDYVMTYKVEVREDGVFVGVEKVVFSLFGS